MQHQRSHCEHDGAEESAPAQGTQGEGAAWWEGLALARAVGLALAGLSCIAAGPSLGFPCVRVRRGLVAGGGSAWLGAGIGVRLIGAVLGGVGRGRHEPIVVTHP